MGRLTIKTAFATICLMAAAAPATAQPVHDRRCAPTLNGQRVTFDHDTHARWYRRFWTGDCKGLLFCQRGSPNWGEVLDRAEASGSSDQVTRTCRLGVRLGHEWARDNDIRRIDTDDLRQFSRQMIDADDFGGGLRQVEQAVARRLSN